MSQSETSLKATFPAVHFDARKSQRAGAFASAAGKDFADRTHTGMFERCQVHLAPAHDIGVEGNSSARGFLAQSSLSTFVQNYAQQSYRKLPKTTKNIYAVIEHSDKLSLSTRWLLQQEDYRRLQNKSFKLDSLYYKKSSSERAPPPHFSGECRFN